MSTIPPPPSAEQQLAERIAEHIRPRMLIGLQDAELYDAPGTERINEWATSIANWAAEVVQPEVNRLRAENVRLRTAWHSARHRANHNHLVGQRFPGGAVREALVHAGYINRRDTVASAVEKINDAPRKWYVSWLTHNLTRLGRAHVSTVAQAKQQARRADRLRAERDQARAQATAAYAFAGEMADSCPAHGPAKHRCNADRLLARLAAAAAATVGES
jgi:hypothetical protein